MKRLSVAASAAVLSLLVAACGDGGDDVASDPGPGDTTAEPTPTPAQEPTVGTYPAFEPEDYAYTLVVACFCAGAGTPVDVTVRDGEVVEAVYDGDGRGAEDGTPADTLMWLTINDVIDEANDTEAASVQVEWPAGQDYPSSVYVDQDLSAADEERGYEVSNVVVG
ncbi:DUF6174 domain-containing protein [Nocardioides sp.]|uniref:DUF6174 domain-containing protein n=1 Tax=Nocardioides sp. TaxID=35761 RepID=UPI001A333D47|nr:DUF6174 domain-containing protein [Nocardioides sp.]MBJ7359734.1 hypothetical protein [Nocardioides sp.]